MAAGVAVNVVGAGPDLGTELFGPCSISSALLKSFFKEKFLLSLAGVWGVPGVCGVLGVVGVLSGDELRLFAALESASIA